MNTGKTRRLKTMKLSKGTIVSRKKFLVRYLEAIISNTEKENRQIIERKSSEEKRTVIEKKNRLVNDQEFQTNYYSNSYANQSNRREQTVDQWK
ncbi:hypothetical protein AVEN_172472-1 [Araneus ventricosus]|uniref:Uncharacterized protein n=1 Tax=Araneus ventricosus TaxID=182803 RepID=A0A4Y2DXN1_ARAVE|nr:hypothetical protein AVEN_172472-1 [Araneus ventricosus]